MEVEGSEGKRREEKGNEVKVIGKKGMGMKWRK